MKRCLLLAVAATTLLAVCADRPRKNPLDPKNPDSKRDRAVLVELFTSDAMIFDTVRTVPYLDTASVVITTITGDTVTLVDTTLPGTTTVHITTRKDSAGSMTDSTVTTSVTVIPDTAGNDTNNYHYWRLITLKDSTYDVLDTIQWHDSLEIRIADSYDAGNVIIAEYHLLDEYAFDSADSLWNEYRSTAGFTDVAAAFFNGTGALSTDLSDTGMTTEARYQKYSTALGNASTDDPSYYTLEGDLSVSNSGDSLTTLTGSGKLARLGSEDGGSITVRYLFTRYLNADHPYVAVGMVEDAFQLAAPEAGEIYTLPSRSITVPAAIGADYANIIVTVQDAATGEVLQATLGN